MRLISTAVLALTIGLAGMAPALARTALKDDPTIENGLVMVAVGKMLRDGCDDISPRYLKAYAFAKSLESRARELGYSRAEIEDYLESREDKKRVKAKAREWLAARGQDICEVGRAEIARGGIFGDLMRVD